MAEKRKGYRVRWSNFEPIVTIPGRAPDAAGVTMTGVEFERQAHLETHRLLNSPDAGLRKLGERQLAAAFGRRAKQSIASAKNVAAGKAGAESRWAGRADIAKLIKDLAKQHDELGDLLTPDELWPQLYSKLEEAELRPLESEPKRYAYSGGVITYEAFRKTVQRARA